MFSISGQRVLSIDRFSDDEIDLSNLNEGLYILEFRGSDLLERIRIMVE